MLTNTQHASHAHLRLVPMLLAIVMTLFTTNAPATVALLADSAHAGGLASSPGSDVFNRDRGDAQTSDQEATSTSPTAEADEDPFERRGVISDRWYALEIHDTHAGFMRVRQERTAADAPVIPFGEPDPGTAEHDPSPAGSRGPTTRSRSPLGDSPSAAAADPAVEPNDLIRTRSETRLSMSRGATVILVELATAFVERADGTPVEMWSYQKMSDQAVETTYRFEGKRIGIYRGRRPDFRADNVTVPEPNDWLDAPERSWMTPVEAGRYMQARVRNNERWMSYRTLDPAYGVEPVTIRRRLIDRNVRVQSGDETIEGTRWRVWQSTMPTVASTEVLDDNGNLIEGQSNLGGLVELNMQIADASVLDRVGPPPELLVSTFVRPDERIPFPRRTTRAEYVLSVADGRLDDLPSGVGSQSSQRIDWRRVRVTVDARRSHAASVEDAANAAYLRSSAFIDHEHPAIIALYDEATRRLPPNASDAQKAEALRSFVLGHIRNKNLAKGFAAASEAAVDQAGDCTEHAVLLAALLRSADIPARLIAGLVYVDQFEGERDVFGYHMWTQALIDGRWVDYDATMQRRFDATHIALIDAALEDDNVAARMTPMLPLLGRLEIEVVDADRSGIVGANALPWVERRSRETSGRGSG
ncbi:MAG: transglutaminase-like domain-containing protein [Planctomycetota bacterium]